jgi:hypothetical protein
MIMIRTQESFRIGVQFLFSLIVLLFCMYKLTTSPDNQPSNALYWSGITGILAYWMPSPGARRDDGFSMNANKVNIEKAETNVTTSSPISPQNGSANSLPSLEAASEKSLSRETNF